MQAYCSQIPNLKILSLKSSKADVSRYFPHIFFHRILKQSSKEIDPGFIVDHFDHENLNQNVFGTESEPSIFRHILNRILQKKRYLS